MPKQRILLICFYILQSYSLLILFLLFNHNKSAILLYWTWETAKFYYLYTCIVSESDFVEKVWLTFGYCSLMSVFILLKHLNSLTSIFTISCLGGGEVHVLDYGAWGSGFKPHVHIYISRFGCKTIICQLMLPFLYNDNTIPFRVLNITLLRPIKRVFPL